MPVVVQVARGFFHKALSLQDSSVMMSLLVQCRVWRLGGEHFRRCTFGIIAGTVGHTFTLGIGMAVVREGKLSAWGACNSRYQILMTVAQMQYYFLVAC